MMNRFFTLLFAASCLTAVGQVPDYVPTEGLVAWYPFNGNANDESQYANHGTVVGASLTEDRFGLPHSAFSFDGNDHIESPHAEWLNHGSNSYSWGGWALNSGTPGWGHLLTKAIHTANPYSGKSRWLRTGGDSFLALSEGEAGNGYTDQSNGVVCQIESIGNEWFHLIGVIDKESEMKVASIYLNGQLLCSAAIADSSYVSDQEGMLVFGCEDPYINLPSGPQYFVGKLDDLGIWNRALSSEEIQGLFDGIPPTVGCTDENACNFNPAALVDDGSCHFLCQYCKEGTVWDEVVQGCIVAKPSDSNFDGCVQLNDLLDLLSAYGDCGAEESPWQCGDPLEYQGYDYETVQIGEQCWFAENLRSELYLSGDSIPASLSDSEWSVTVSGAAAIYGEGSRDCDDFSPDGDACDEAWSLNEYGWLYNWYSVSDVRGLCPSGWHVPSDNEWIEMEMALGMTEAEANTTSWRGTNEGHQMKADYGWNNDGAGTNSSGFSCLAGGYSYDDGRFDGAGVSSVLWSSTPDGSVAWSRNLVDERMDVARTVNAKNLGGSVRCIKDAE